MTTKTKSDLLKELCLGFITRSRGLSYRGKKRDDAAMDYLVGAAMALREVGLAEESDFIARNVALVISVRGYEEVERISKGEEA